MPQLRDLPPGTRFRVRDLGITGRLMMVNDCRARVRLDKPERDVAFTGSDGERRVFHARPHSETSWTPAVDVEVLSLEPISETEDDMTTKTKKTEKKAPATKAKGKGPKLPAIDLKKAPAKAKPAKAPKTDGKMSALDAAAKVLLEAGEPLTTKAMIEQMAGKGYWSSPGGKTPEATLYSAILRELKKGPESRFTKVDRGRFELSAYGKKA